MRYVIRLFQESDGPELWQLHVAAVLAAGLGRDVVEWDTDLHSITEHYTAKGGHFVVAQAEDGKLIGMGGYKPTSATSVELKRMRVHPDFQHAGVGTAVLEALELEAVRSGYTLSHLDTANHAAQPFYQRNGYRFVKSESEGEFNFYFYEKRLGPAE